MDTYQSQSVVFGRAFLDTIISAWKTVPGGALITGAKVRLSKDPLFNPNPGNVPADFTAHEADFGGYPAGGIALVVGAPVNLSPTCQGAVTPVMFTATSSATPNTVFGYWIDDGTNVIAAETFAGGATATFGTAGDFLVLVLQLPEQTGQATA